MNAIKINGLYKQNGVFRMEDLNLKLPKGYIKGIVSQNGTGKSALIHHMIGLMKTDRGRIEILDSENMEKIVPNY